MIRQAKSEDLLQIQELLDDVFAPSRFESRLERLVSTSKTEHWAWVSHRDSEIVSYVLYTRAFKGAEPIGFHLERVAVSPESQRKGLGSTIIEYSLNREPVRSSPVFVLGDPQFYERLGFTTLANPRCLYDPENRNFRALRWHEPEESFTVGYVDAFREAE